ASRSCPFYQDLVFIGENEGVWLDHKPLDRLATLAGYRVGSKQARVLHQLGATQSLQHRIDLANMDRAAERPAGSVGTAADGMEIAVERVEGIALQAGRGGPRTGTQLCYDRDAAVDRGLDQHARADDARFVQPPADPLQRLLVGDQLLETKPAVLT